MPARRTAQSPKPPSWSEWKAQHQQKPWYQRYPLAVEWRFEQLNDLLHRLAFVEFLEHAGKFAVLIAVIFWMFEADDRTKERHYRAWELINSARGSTADGGRIDALQDLNEDGVNLAGAPLEEAWLVGIDLRGGAALKALTWRAPILRAPTSMVLTLRMLILASS